MVEKRFEKLGMPDIERFENYLPTAFSSELTLLQKVNKIIQDLNRSFDLSNEIVDYLNRFIEMFDSKLNQSVKDILEEWRNDGLLAELMLEITGILSDYQLLVEAKLNEMQINIQNVEQKHLQDMILINNQIAELIHYINRLENTLNVFKDETNTNIVALEYSISNLNSVFSERLNKIELNVNQLSGFELVDSVPNVETLNSKYPNGVSGLVYVQADGYWYVYNNGWKKGSSFNTPTNISINSLNFTVTDNLYDPSKVTSGKYVDFTNGLLFDNESYCVTPFIPVVSGKTYYLSARQQIAFYSGSNEASFISGVEVGAVVKIPSNVTYIRTNVLVEDKNSFYFGLYHANISGFSPRIPYTKLDSETNQLLSGIRNTLIPSKNLFNSAKVTIGQYVSWTNGVLDNNPDFCVTDFIMLKPNTTYYKNDNQQCAFYYGNKQATFVIGMETGNFFTTDNDIRFVRITIPLNKLSTFMLAESDIVVPFEPFGYYLPNQNGGDMKLINSNQNLQTILANAKPNETNYLNSGNYETMLNLKNYQSNVVGLSKTKTILSNKENHYDRPPLIVSGNASFENLILHAKTNGKPSEKPPYSAHIDYSGEGHLIFTNVDFISDTGQGVGIGLHENQTIEFINCRFYGYTNAFYAHCNIDSQTKNQKLICKECYFYSELDSAIRIDDSNQIFGDKKGTTMVVEFINCLLDQKNKNLPLVNAYNSPITGISGNVKLSEKSCGNNVVALNNNGLLIDKMLRDYQNGLLG